MLPQNPFHDKIRTLDDVSLISPMAKYAVELVRATMTIDSCHDERHLTKVVRNALWFGEKGDREIIAVAGVLHDLVNVPKESPLRSEASKLSADKADLLLSEEFPQLRYRAKIFPIHHAILSHSWSAGIKPMTLEAKVIQDADRIESIGAMGIARLFSCGGQMGRVMFHPTDPLGENRPLDEKVYTLDHYLIKLESIYKTMNTQLGANLAVVLTSRMKAFVSELIEEM